MVRQAGETARQWYDRALQEVGVADDAVMGYVVVGSEHPPGSLAITPEHRLAADRWKAAQEDLERAREAVAREA